MQCTVTLGPTRNQHRQTRRFKQIILMRERTMKLQETEWYSTAFASIKQMKPKIASCDPKYVLMARGMLKRHQAIPASGKTARRVAAELSRLVFDEDLSQCYTLRLKRLASRVVLACTAVPRRMNHDEIPQLPPRPRYGLLRYNSAGVGREEVV